jgi:hypothetical protein
MDRASILGDAIEYLKELLQRINDLHTELEAAGTQSSSQQSLAAAGSTLACRTTVKEECPNNPSLSIITDIQPARVSEHSSSYHPPPPGTLTHHLLLLSSSFPPPQCSIINNHVQLHGSTVVSLCLFSFQIWL